MVRDLPAGEPDAAVTLAPRPDERWLRLYERDVPVDVLTAVIDGEVVFGRIGDAGVGRAAVTGRTRRRAVGGPVGGAGGRGQRRRGHARALCSALLAWGAERGATRAYVQVLVDNAAAITLYESMGFATQHRARYLDAAVGCSACGWPPGTSTPSAPASTGSRTGWSAPTSTCWPCRRPSAPTTSSPPCRSPRSATRWCTAGSTSGTVWRSRRGSASTTCRSASRVSRRGATSPRWKRRRRPGRWARPAAGCGCGACTCPTAAPSIPRTTGTSWNGLPR